MTIEPDTKQSESKKLDGGDALDSVRIAWYNFCRVHSTLRVTPAMEAGITNHVWEIGELILAGNSIF